MKDGAQLSFLFFPGEQLLDYCWITAGIVGHFTNLHNPLGLSLQRLLGCGWPQEQMRKRDVHTKECLQRVSRALNRRWRRERDRRAGSCGVVRGRAGISQGQPKLWWLIPTGSYWLRERERDTHTHIFGSELGWTRTSLNAFNMSQTRTQKPDAVSVYISWYISVSQLESSGKKPEALERIDALIKAMDATEARCPVTISDFRCHQKSETERTRPGWAGQNPERALANCPGAGTRWHECTMALNVVPDSNSTLIFDYVCINLH